MGPEEMFAEPLPMEPYWVPPPPAPVTWDARDNPASVWYKFEGTQHPPQEVEDTVTEQVCRRLCKVYPSPHHWPGDAYNDITALLRIIDRLRT